MINESNKIILSINTVEELVFANPSVYKLFPDFDYLFKSWRLAVTSGLSHMAKRSLTDFMTRITKQHIDILEKYFGRSVIVRKLDYSLVSNHECPVNAASDIFEKNEKSYVNFSISRDDSILYISLWR